MLKRGRRVISHAIENIMLNACIERETRAVNGKWLRRRKETTRGASGMSTALIWPDNRLIKLTRPKC